MKIIDAAGASETEIEKIARRPAFDEIPLSPKVKNSIKAVFGQAWDARRVVEEIVAGVREQGDAKAIYYTEA
ncbi:MAG: histidinol dehydrogenase, partial [Acidaminococcales bacterium]|nr:histidinol dehydrogenase [Acidaminococcales bacterium]